MQDKWLNITRIEVEMNSLREDEMAGSSNSAANNQSKFVVQTLIFPREADGAYSSFHLKMRYAGDGQSTNSSGNEQFSES